MELKEYYKKCESKILKWSIAGWALLSLIFNILKDNLNNAIVNWPAGNISKEILVWFFAWVTPTSIILVLYYSICDHINKKHWKKKFPQYDISGEWKDTTKYTKCLDSRGWNDFEFSSDSPVQIVQTCKSIKI